MIFSGISRSMRLFLRVNYLALYGQNIDPSIATKDQASSGVLMPRYCAISLAVSDACFSFSTPSMRNRPFRNSDTVTAPCRYTSTEAVLRRNLLADILLPTFDSSRVMLSGGRTFAVCSPHRRVKALTG